MKKAILAVLLVGGLSGSVFAQKQDKPRAPKEMSSEQRAERMTRHMEQKLELTAEQKQKVQQLNLRTAEQMQPLRQQMKALRQQMRAVNQQRQNELKQILTPEQQQKMEQMKQERRSNMHKKSRKWYRRSMQGGQQQMQQQQPAKMLQKQAPNQ